MSSPFTLDSTFYLITCFIAFRVPFRLLFVRTYGVNAVKRTFSDCPSAVCRLILSIRPCNVCHLMMLIMICWVIMLIIVSSNNVPKSVQTTLNIDGIKDRPTTNSRGQSSASVRYDYCLLVLDHHRLTTGPIRPLVPESVHPLQ